VATLGVNIDHVATLRQARGVAYPDPLAAAYAAEAGGADSTTVHLCEDRRHIQDADLTALRQALHVGLNLELAASPEMVVIALRVRPADVCVVRESRRSGRHRLECRWRRLRPYEYSHHCIDRDDDNRYLHRS
jgi:pyridoxine 5-phosphate synthase